MLKRTATHPLIPIDHQQWLPYGILTSTRVTDDLRIGGRLLRQLYNKTNVNLYKYFNYFSTAKLVNVGKYGGNRRIYSHNTRYSPSSPMTTNPTLWWLLTVFDRDLLLRVTLHLNRIEQSINSWSAHGHKRWYFFKASSRVQVVCLSYSVRRAAVLHKCDEDCEVSPNKIYQHSCDILCGGSWTNIGEKGDHPHMGWVRRDIQRHPTSSHHTK